MSSTPIEPHERRGGANGTDGVQTINHDDPSAIGRLRPTRVDELQSSVISQQTLVAFMTCAGMEESSVEPVTIAVS